MRWRSENFHFQRGGIFKGEVDTPLHTMIFLFYRKFSFNFLVLIKKFLETLQPYSELATGDVPSKSYS